MKPLEGKVSLVTGGTRGIGRAIVLALADAGCHVVFNYAQSKTQAEELVALARQKGVRAEAFQANVANETEINTMAEQVLAAFGPISILVNNAGITRDRSFLKMTRSQWDEVIRINLDGVFNVTHAFLAPMLSTGWGRIINLSSVVGLTGNFGQTNYAATKGGLNSFTMALAREVARKGVTVNSVAPGFITTDMTKDVPQAVVDQVVANTPVGRMGTPEEVAAAVVFLASPAASYITGQILSVNGGMYM